MEVLNQGAAAQWGLTWLPRRLPALLAPASASLAVRVGPQAPRPLALPWPLMVSGRGWEGAGRAGRMALARACALANAGLRAAVAPLWAGEPLLVPRWVWPWAPGRPVPEAAAMVELDGQGEGSPEVLLKAARRSAPGLPTAVRLGASAGALAAMAAWVKAGADAVVLAEMTGPIALPVPRVLAEVRRLLVERGWGNRVSVIAAVTVRGGEELALYLALGADAVEIPAASLAKAPQTALPGAAYPLAQGLRQLQRGLANLMRDLGVSDLQALRGSLAAMDEEAARAFGLPPWNALPPPPAPDLNRWVAGWLEEWVRGLETWRRLAALTGGEAGG